MSTGNLAGEFEFEILTALKLKKLKFPHRERTEGQATEHATLVTSAISSSMRMGKRRLILLTTLCLSGVTKLSWAACVLSMPTKMTLAKVTL
jgi:hypothetical protein